MKWIKCSEKLPADQEMVMFCGPDWKYWDIGTFDAKDERFLTEKTYGWDDEQRPYSIGEATHWMPQSAIPLPRK